jgi:hypothetical protein
MKEKQARRWWLMSVILATQEGRDQEDHGLRPTQETKARPYLKNSPTQKTAGRVAQVVEPSKYDALSLNPSTTKNKRKERKKSN